MRSFADVPGSSACRWLCQFCCAMAALSAWPSPAPARGAGPAPQLRLIALTGQQAPDTEPGVTFFNSLEPVVGKAPRIDGDGSIVFAPFLAGPGLPPGEQAIYFEQRGTLELVVRNGDPAPGAGPGAVFLTNGFFVLAPTVAAGRIAFRSVAAVPGISAAGGIWSGPPDDLQLVALANTQAPGLPFGVTMGVAGFVFNTAGHTLMGSFLSGSGVNTNNDESLWSDRGGSLALVVREGDPAPGTGAVFGAASSVFAPGGLRFFNFNAQSRVALHGNIAGAGIDDFNDEGIWIEEDGVLALVVREGDPAPGFDSSVHIAAGNGIDCFVGPLINASGALMFAANMTGLPELQVPSLSAEGLWSTRSGELEIVAHYGQQPPGEPLGYFAGFGQFSLNQAGQVAFIGIVPGPLVGGDIEDFGIWWDGPGPGALTRLLRDGTQVPGLPDGVIFGTTAPTNTLSFVLLSFAPDGNLLFTSFLTGPGISGQNNFGLFRADPDRGIQALVRTGDMLDVSGDGSDLRTVIDIQPGNLSDDADTVFKVLFSDGSIAIFTTAPAQPPSNPADLDGDGDVDVNDLLAVISAWGTCPTPPAPCPADIAPPPASGGGDGLVNIADLLMLIANWG
ncbi:MAG: hypothetical protein L0Y42_07190 [Phycisphaerales bacterium]|nr:hypothetical protein [Phycisphaerales bacterium]